MNTDRHHGFHLSARKLVALVFVVVAGGITVVSVGLFLFLIYSRVTHGTGPQAPLLVPAAMAVFFSVVAFAMYRLHIDAARELQELEDKRPRDYPTPRG
jgi:uncharacterized membrane protein